MSDQTDRPDDDLTGQAGEPPAETATTELPAEAEAQPKLNLHVEIEKPSACERRITVRVSREDIERYFNKEFSELMPAAHVPGFRPGRAPRRLVEKHFRKQIGEKVKAQLLYDSVEQINADYRLTPISEPSIDIDAVELPDEGELVYEFEIEVRPEFDLPQWKGLKLRVPQCEVSDADIDYYLARILEDHGRLVPYDGPAQLNQSIVCDVVFRHEGKELSRYKDCLLRLRPKLSLVDGEIETFGSGLEGVKAGESRTLTAVVAKTASNEALRGKEVEAEFRVHEVKRIELPELTPEFLDSLGAFESEAELRDAVRDSLADRLKYEQRKVARQQVSALLTEAADWELPPQLLERQTERELRRAVLELQASGFSNDEIQAHENRLRRNAGEMVAAALKEHFILERVAEEEKIAVSEEDFENEIREISLRQNESPRRIRAQLEKSGAMDVLANQIIERKVMDLILENAQYEYTPYEFPKTMEEVSLTLSICGTVTSDIPEATSADAAPAEGGRPGEPRRYG